MALVISISTCSFPLAHILQIEFKT